MSPDRPAPLQLAAPTSPPREGTVIDAWPPNSGASEASLGWLEVALPLWHRRWRLLASMLLCGVLALGLAFTRPLRYTGQASFVVQTVLRPSQSAVSGALPALAGLIGGGGSSQADLQRLDRVLALPEARPPAAPATGVAGDDPRTWFGSAPHWPSQTPRRADLEAWFGTGWRQVETTPAGEVLSFFHTGPGDEPLHVVTRSQELRVLRPHGHLLRSGSHWTPDERAVASTVWMGGVFHSSLTQGHASANRCLSTQRGHRGLFRALGLRVLVAAGRGWQLL
ncbi:MAG: hypothetical protein CFE45_17525, partial [Burkholderiales bacterium PBB5]